MAVTLAPLNTLHRSPEIGAFGFATVLPLRAACFLALGYVSKLSKNIRLAALSHANSRSCLPNHNDGSGEKIVAKIRWASAVLPSSNE